MLGEFDNACVWHENVDPEWEPTWIIENIWQQHSVNFFAGPPKRARKSSLRRYFLACALTGESAFGIFKANKIDKVLVMLGEDKEPQERKALDAAIAALGHPPLEAGRVCYASIYDFDLRNPMDVRKLAIFITKQQFDFVLIDPLVEFYKGDENSANEMAEVGRNLRKLCKIAGIALTHHTAKPPATMDFGQYNPRTLGEMMRGSGVLGGISDCTVGSTPIGDSKMRVRLAFEIKVPPEGGEPEPLEVEIDQKRWIWEPAAALDTQTILSIVDEEPGIGKEELKKRLGRKSAASTALINDMIDSGQLVYDKSNGINLP